MPKSPEELAHQEWLGYVQPVGLVVSTPAMLQAQCYVNKNIMAEHACLLSCLARENDQPIPEIDDLAEFTQKVLDWEAADFVELSDQRCPVSVREQLTIALPQYNEILRPTHVVFEFESGKESATTDNRQPAIPILLVQELAAGTELDKPGEADSARHWNAAPQAKFERLLRETGVPIGLLSNRRSLRLVYAPKGESSGHATFHVDEMTQVAGRPMFAALHMLLCADRMFSLSDDQRLPAILANSRKYQNTVSTKLAEQVTSALFELLRGFQAANDHRGGDLLRQILEHRPQHVYNGLLTVLMRLVFVLYAEDRGLISSDPVYTNHYSITGLFERLRGDQGRFPDTMHQRFGAWAQLLTLFRLIYEGGQHGDLAIPGRKGYLFDPNRYPFLEGRFDDGDVNVDSVDELDSEIQIPRISDGVVYDVLAALLILDGERLSYRTLDVEQIGSVYEAVMGFELQVADGKSIAIKPVKRHGAPATINLEALLATEGKDRAKWINERTDQKITGKTLDELKAAASIDGLLAALDKKIAWHVTPAIVPAESMVFQPSDERRRSGSHYTPRSLTEPIVRTTLEPILKQLVTHPDEAKRGAAETQPDDQNSGPDTASPRPRASVVQPNPIAKELRRRLTKGEIAERQRLEQQRADNHTAAIRVGVPHPSQILDLKICDPAMGSGAFLVEACRQLADQLVESWAAHADSLTPHPQSLIPPDEDEVLYARRLIAQRCLYGVDKNPMAVDLAKLSLWLVTLAKDHPFTFLDHSLRHGDSLVGLTRSQIIGFHWEPKKQKTFGEELIQKRLDRATEARAKILNAREDVAYRDQEQRLAVADEALNIVRLTGDACVSAFFAGSKKKKREQHREHLLADVAQHYQNLQEGKFDAQVRHRIAQAAASLKTGEHPIPPFHWEIEFPEVFSRENGGFDAFVGNPPFAGKNSWLSGNRHGCLDWLKIVHEGTHGNADIVAHFFRRTFQLVRQCGSFGLIATNTICQGDTRTTGLSWIRSKGATIYYAQRRYRWPGQAAVIVSVVAVFKGSLVPPFVLDGTPVSHISAYLFPLGTDDNPHILRANARLCSNGVKIYGTGFTFDDSDNTGLATPIARMKELLDNDRRNRERIFPYVGGEELNTSPTQSHHRYVINFGEFELNEAEKWPELLEIVREHVKPQRAGVKDEKCRLNWWQYDRPRTEFFDSLSLQERVLALSRVGNHVAFVFVAARFVFADSLVVFRFQSYADFCLLQSRVHECWARFFSSSMKDDLRYTSSDCFETFPFPSNKSAKLEDTGCRYHETRASTMHSNDQGLTDTYNRFHDPYEKSPEIVKLRELHEAMDRAVLEAYGWHDLAESAHCEFLLDYEEEEDEDTGRKKSKKKKPWRLRWPDEFRDEVLARLLELNEQRHKEELLLAKQAAPGDQAKKTSGGKSTGSTKRVSGRSEDRPPQKELF